MAKQANILQPKESTNLFNKGSIDIPQETVQERIDGKKIPPGTIKNRHLQHGLFAVLVDSTRPTEGNEYRFHFDPTTGVLSAWDGSSWLTTTLS